MIDYHYEGKYIGLYENEKIRIYAKIGKYSSGLFNEEYDVITSLIFVNKETKQSVKESVFFKYDEKTSQKIIVLADEFLLKMDFNSFEIYKLIKDFCDNKITKVDFYIYNNCTEFIWTIYVKKNYSVIDKIEGIKATKKAITEKSASIMSDLLKSNKSYANCNGLQFEALISSVD